MKSLLAIVSCAAHANLEQSQRKTFLRDCPMDYLFFRGKNGSVLSAPADVTILDVPDDFLSLPFKVQAMVRWALDCGYERVFKMDTDSYARPERLMACEPHEYTGYFHYEPCRGAYGSGGSGYWLGRRAMEIVAAAELAQDTSDMDRMRLSTRGEDFQIGRLLDASGIPCHKDGRYRLRDPGPMATNDYITLHDVMLDKTRRIEVAHRAWVLSGGKP